VARRDVRGALLRCVCPGKRGFGHFGHPADRPCGSFVSRPGFLEAERRRAEFARLVAEDLRMGGLDQASANVVRNARSARLSLERALRLSYQPGFVAEVERLVGFREAA
jgi:hypothetical protein